MGLFTPNIRELLARRDVSGLIDALKSRDLKVSAQAAFALGELGPEAGIAHYALLDVLKVNEKARSKLNLEPKNLKEFRASQLILDQGKCIQEALEKINRFF